MKVQKCATDMSAGIARQHSVKIASSPPAGSTSDACYTMPKHSSDFYDARIIAQEAPAMMLPWPCSHARMLACIKPTAVTRQWMRLLRNANLSQELLAAISTSSDNTC
jgi:hypothetical protein